MTILLPVAASLLAAVLAEGLPTFDLRPPTVFDLELALHAVSGEEYGADDSPLKPHELLLRMDVESVPDDLLLGVLLAGASSGDPLDAARRLMAESNHDVTRLLEPSLWANTKGVGTVGRARIVAAAELARRMEVRSAFSRRKTITSPASAVDTLRSMSFGPDEILSVLFLDRRRRLIGGQILTVGSSAFTIVDPAQVYRRAIEAGAGAVLLCHNHPSGDATPSPQDNDVTDRVSRVGRVVGIPLVDHIVLGAGGTYTSFAETGRLPHWPASGVGWTGEP